MERGSGEDEISSSAESPSSSSNAFVTIACMDSDGSAHNEPSIVEIYEDAAFLSSSCGFFRGMFSSQMIESGGRSKDSAMRVDLSRFSKRTISCVLQLLREPDMDWDTSMYATLQDAIDSLIVSDYFEAPVSRAACLRRLSSLLSNSSESSSPSSPSLYAPFRILSIAAGLSDVPLMRLSIELLSKQPVDELSRNLLSPTLLASFNAYDICLFLEQRFLPVTPSFACSLICSWSRCYAEQQLPREKSILQSQNDDVKELMENECLSRREISRMISRRLLKHLNLAELTASQFSSILEALDSLGPQKQKSLPIDLRKSLVERRLHLRSPSASKECFYLSRISNVTSFDVPSNVDIHSLPMRLPIPDGIIASLSSSSSSLLRRRFSASSIASNQMVRTGVNAIASRGLENFWTNDSPNSFIEIDFGLNCFVSPTGYTMACRSPPGFTPTSWVLLGRCVAPWEGADEPLQHDNGQKQDEENGTVDGRCWRILDMQRNNMAISRSPCLASSFAIQRPNPGHALPSIEVEVDVPLTDYRDIYPSAPLSFVLSKAPNHSSATSSSSAALSQLSSRFQTISFGPSKPVPQPRQQNPLQEYSSQPQPAAAAKRPIQFQIFSAEAHTTPSSSASSSSSHSKSVRSKPWTRNLLTRLQQADAMRMFNRFRLIQIGPNTGSAYHFIINGFELHGDCIQFPSAAESEYDKSSDEDGDDFDSDEEP